MDLLSLILIWLFHCNALANERYVGDASLPLSMEALGRAVGEDENSPCTLDACRRWCGVRAG